MGLSKTGRMSPRSRMGAKWLSKVKKGQIRPNKADSVTLSVVHLSPLGSQLSFQSVAKIETVVDWDAIRKKYLALTSNELDKDDSKDSNEDHPADADSAGNASPANGMSTPS